MIEALIAGQRDPRALADLAMGKMHAKRKALIEALDGKLEDHHAVEARILLRHIDGLTRDIDDLTARAGELITQIPAARGIDADGPEAGGNPVPSPCPPSPGWTRSPAAAPSPPWRSSRK